jgi:hypothetical protein
VLFEKRCLQKKYKIKITENGAVRWRYGANEGGVRGSRRKIPGDTTAYALAVGFMSASVNALSWLMYAVQSMQPVAARRQCRAVAVARGYRAGDARAWRIQRPRVLLRLLLLLLAPPPPMLLRPALRSRRGR